jgi:nitroreductase
MEVGFAAENVLLQTAEIGLGAVFIGAFHDDEVRDVLDLPANEEPLGLIPIGHPRRSPPTSNN